MTSMLIGTGLFLIILGLIVAFLGYSLDSDSKATTVWVGMVAGIILAIGVSCLGQSYKESHEPTALDVYRGKTELIYTIELAGKDTVAVDSIVVFKNND